MALTLTARSVLASALLGQKPPELPVAHLVHLASLFGINENRARVALSRMAAAGEVSNDGSGRYRLEGHLLARQERQNRSRAATTRPWAGRWRLVVVTATGRPAEARSGLRRRLKLARLAEQRDGVWLRPDNIDLEPDPAADPGVAVYRAAPEGDPVALAAALFDLDGWARGAEELDRRLGELRPTGPDDLAAGFELSADRAPPHAGRPPAARRAPSCRVARDGVAPHLRPLGPPVPPGARDMGSLRLSPRPGPGLPPPGRESGTGPVRIGRPGRTRSWDLVCGTAVRSTAAHRRRGRRDDRRVRELCR